MRTILRGLLKTKDCLRRVWKALFYDPKGQVLAISIGLILIGGGIVFTAFGKSKPIAEASGGALLGVGASIVASSIVVKVLAADDDSIMAETGVTFVGSRSTFEAHCRGPRAESAWDSWIQRTPRCGNLIVVGKKNYQWVDKSWPAIVKLLKKKIDVTFVFMELTPDAADSNLRMFLTRASEIDARSINSRNLSFYRYIPPMVGSAPSTLADTGYYWNGCELMVKVYVQNGENYDCPIIVFASPGVSQTFNAADFDPDTIPLARADSLIQVGRALGRVLADSIKLNANDYLNQH